MPHVHGAGGRHGGRQAKLVVYARVLGVAAAVGSLVQAWGAASQRRPVGEGMDVGAVEEFGLLSRGRGALAYLAHLKPISRPPKTAKMADFGLLEPMKFR